MKRILLDFYSCRNLGDDIFVKIFSDYFRDCRINLIVNLRYIPKDLRKNVKIHPISLIHTVAGKIQSILGWDSKISADIQKYLIWQRRRIEKKQDAVVLIGGSVFMGKKSKGRKEIPFRTEEHPEYIITGRLEHHSNRFVIGANLGPAYSTEYWDNIKSVLRDYTHVCLRDYSSYCMVKELSHVQYAPDVLFLTPRPDVDCGERVVISVIDIRRYTLDASIISSYYTLLQETIQYFKGKSIPVTLVSFCERDGDEAAIEELLTRIKDKDDISTCFYRGDIQEILRIFAGASFVIGSRFHSVILGILYGKPVFPVSYNCKTENYLADLQFKGKYAILDQLPSLKVEDIVYNYENRIITDCSEHKKYAENQFWGLKEYLYGDLKQ